MAENKNCSGRNHTINPSPTTMHLCANSPQVCSILESISDGVFTVNKEWIISSFNRAAKNITGVSKQDAIGKNCWDVFKANTCETGCPLRKTMKDGKPIINHTAYIINSNSSRIPVSISTAILKNDKGEIIGGVETFRDLSIEEKLKQKLNSFAPKIISHSQSMQHIMHILPDIANSESAVLIVGDTGTGKELLAKEIHNLSPRRNKPFIAVNCGALPDSLIESELFGYVKGAFTDAKHDKPGRFALAEGGTIFLDEIGDISTSLQVKLLRVLQEKIYEPLGGTKSIFADVRIITATNKKIEKMVETKTFRSDLYYRINVICLELPPLSKRKEDIPILIRHFIRILTGNIVVN